MYSAGPDMHDQLDLDALRRFITTWDWRVNSVGFYGGEVTLQLAAYKSICDMLPAGLQRWMFSNGTWSAGPSERIHEVIQWTIDNRVSPIIVSGTRYHQPYQDWAVLESLARTWPEHIWLKADEGHYLPMGRLAGLMPFSCKRRCETDARPMRIAVQPDGSVIFQTCDGRYPVIGDITAGFPELADRCTGVRENYCRAAEVGDFDAMDGTVDSETLA
jgi:hypothetical protein